MKNLGPNIILLFSLASLILLFGPPCFGAAASKQLVTVEHHFANFSELKDAHGALIPDDIRRRAVGAFMGVLVGDAAGAACEYASGEVPSPGRLDEAMNMVGGPATGAIWGSQWRGAGQVTDDSEQTMATAEKLAKCTNDTVNPEVFLDAMMEWGKTGWAAGKQTRKALSIAESVQRAYPPAVVGIESGQRYMEHVRSLRKSDETESLRSEANGSLMRSIPLAIWGYDLSEDQLFDLVKKAAQITHTAHAVHYAEGFYIIVAAKLIKTGDVETALKETKTWFKKLESEIDTPSKRESWDRVAQWIKDAERFKLNKSILWKEHSKRGFQSRGWCRWAFTFSLAHLMAGTKWPVAIREIIKWGGDTDTNACIAGGLLGAAQGIAKIPDNMISAVLSRDGTSDGVTVPPRYYTNAALKKADALLSARARSKKYH
eukprot:GHVT01092930.1.p1 GENE.GHVT01092930.1~~GHVT01092930.1.p1  ORF type:complete len:431 (-),score=47.08 GHVT01092930.1:5845-7137(-)